MHSGGDFDIAYLTELDPTWRDDELGFILNQAILFGNLIAQAACAADSQHLRIYHWILYFGVRDRKEACTH